jgi:hypothetical protein
VSPKPGSDWVTVKIRVDLGDNENVSSDRHEIPTTGWAVKVPPGEYERRERRWATLRTWLPPRNLLAVILPLWNGYFLAAILYGLTVQDPAGDAVRRIEVTMWFWGDVAIVLIAWSFWVLRRRRRRVA